MWVDGRHHWFTNTFPYHALGLLLSKPLTRELCSRIEESQWLLRETLRVYPRQLQATEHFIEIQGLTLSSVASHGVDWGEP